MSSEGVADATGRPGGIRGVSPRPARGPDAARLPYGRIAQLYDASLAILGFKRALAGVLDRVVQHLPARSCLFDAGCGTGLIAFWFLRRFPEARVVAFDVDRRMLEVMRRAAQALGRDAARLVIAEGDLQQPDRLTRFDDGRPLALADQSFDAIAVGAALEHVALEPTLERLHRLLKRDGRLLILGIRRGGAASVLGLVYRFRPYSVREVRQALTAAGYVDVSVQRLTPRDFPANLTRIAIQARRP